MAFGKVRHPERSRFSGGARDLAWGGTELHARSLRPLVKTRALGMTHLREKLRLAEHPNPGFQFALNGETVNVSASIMAAATAKSQRLAGSGGYSGACFWRKVSRFMTAISPAQNHQP